MSVAISVLVPAFNQEKYIGRCLRSLINQSLAGHEYEVVVVNDGSTDLTAFALDQFDGFLSPKIRVINNSYNLFVNSLIYFLAFISSLSLILF